MRKKTTVLLILDGLGMSDEKKYNAFDSARTPVLDGLMKEYPSARGLSSGIAVGLPNGQPGNAEVGYRNIGAGRIVYQELSRINKEIMQGTFFRNEVLLETISHCKRNDSALHIMGLLSDGGVHSHIRHLYALLELAAKNGLRKVYVHCFTDGRDAPVHSGVRYIELLQAAMREIGAGEIASVSGRYYAMDRDNNYERIKMVYFALTQGEGNKAANAAEAVQTAYDNGITDEFIKPTVIVNGGVPVGTVNDDDAVLFFNFRTDRARELTRAFCEDEFRMFKREKLLNVRFVCFTDYDSSIENKETVFSGQTLANTLGEYISLCGGTQLRLAESEASLYVTSFFDSRQGETFDGEDRLIIRSLKKIDTYADAPGMNSKAVCERLVNEIDGGRYDFILCSLPNADVTGHTGDIEATVRACETVDECVGKIYEAVIRNGSVMFITSTHGKAERMRYNAPAGTQGADRESAGARDDDTAELFTGHTLNPVPIIMINYTEGVGLREIGCLADIAPTILETMGVGKPKEMTGKSLLEMSEKLQ